MDSPGKSLKGKNLVQAPVNNKPEKEEEEEEEEFSMHSFHKKARENQGMDSPGMLFGVKISVQEPINNKPEKEEEGGEGDELGEVQQITIGKRRKNSTPRRHTP